MVSMRAGGPICFNYATEPNLWTQMIAHIFMGSMEVSNFTFQSLSLQGFFLGSKKKNLYYIYFRMDLPTSTKMRMSLSNNCLKKHDERVDLKLMLHSGT